MNFEQRKKIIFEESKNLYEKYSKLGLLSIYWYGSGLNNEDFNLNSDIDLIAIVEDRFDFKYEQEMISILSKNQNLDIRIRILYLSELNGGDFKGLFVTYLPLKLWLIGFGEYSHLQGKQFSLDDFKIKKASFEEAMQIQKDMYVERRQAFLQDSSKAMYLIKSPIHYVYYFCCSREGYFPFSYNSLKKKVPFEFNSILLSLLKIKELNYPKEMIDEILPELDKFMNI